MVPSHAHDIFPMVFSMLLKIICIINFDNKRVLTIMDKLVRTVLFYKMRIAFMGISVHTLPKNKLICPKNVGA